MKYNLTPLKDSKNLQMFGQFANGMCTEVQIIPILDEIFISQEDDILAFSQQQEISEMDFSKIINGKKSDMENFAISNKILLPPNANKDEVKQILQNWFNQQKQEI
ncbi:hypothetical protein [Capnocytophaga canis]|uniref:hypothetical protein n=1 Tax=Capnocytophaga canis TaxID=1848903 RepID=UPI0037D63891